MKVIKKFVCDECGKEYYDKLSAEKCELSHDMVNVLGSFLTCTGKVAKSPQKAINHVVGCQYCKDNMRMMQQIQERDLEMQALSRLAELYR